MRPLASVRRRPPPEDGPPPDGSLPDGPLPDGPLPDGSLPDGPPPDGAPAGQGAEPHAGPAAQTGPPGDGAREKRPLYPRLLRLRHVHPNGWQRAVLGEGALALAAVLVLADLASAWTLVVLPLGVALVVKAHDLLAGLLATGAPHAREAPQDDDGAAPEGDGAGRSVREG